MPATRVAAAAASAAAGPQATDNDDHDVDDSDSGEAQIFSAFERDALALDRTRLATRAAVRRDASVVTEPAADVAQRDVDEAAIAEEADRGLLEYRRGVLFPHAMDFEHGAAASAGSSAGAAAGGGGGSSGSGSSSSTSSSAVGGGGAAEKWRRRGPPNEESDEELSS